jgi:hypothetical protein
MIRIDDQKWRELEKNSSFLDIRGLSRKMQLLIIAFYIYILVLFWAVGQTREGKKESVYTGERERDIFTYVGYRPSRQRSLTFKSQKVPELIVTKKELFYPSN